MSDTLSKIGGETLEGVAEIATTYKTEILAAADTALKEGETSLVNALSGAIKTKVPLVGGTLGGVIATALDGLDVTADAALESGFDAVVAAIKAEAAKLEA